jgi:hypothetical protein
MSKSSADPATAKRWPMVISFDSDVPIPELPQQVPQATFPRRLAVRGPVLLDGQALICPCPDCGAPMAVRSWLLLAECWRCGTRIEISDEWLNDHVTSTAEHAAPTTVIPPEPPIRAEMSAPRPPAPPPTPPPAPDRPQPAVESWSYATIIRRLFRDTPAWIISLLLHLIALTILGLLSLADHDSLFITLSTLISRADSEGARLDNPYPKLPVEFDMPLPDDIDLSNPEDREDAILAKKDAHELQEDPNSSDPQQADLTTVRRQINTPGDMRLSLTARDPRVRSELVSKEGGTTMTEASVARGLRWLAKQQESNGSWQLHGFDGGAKIHSPTSATGMALLAFLGAGQTHLHGKYRNEVAQGLAWLLNAQADDGGLRGRSDSQAAMYAHGQASIALCEAFLMTGDDKLREPCQKAIDFIVAAQYDDGGWRYGPHNPARPVEGDTSVLGWQLMALQSARAARLQVPPETLELAGQFLDGAGSDDGSRYAYLASRPYPSPTMTAEALLCRIYLGWDHNQFGLSEGVRYLSRKNRPEVNSPNIYYWYYATQVMHHYGGRPWDAWNERMREILVRTQRVRGSNAGSWDPKGPHAASGGRLYFTALAVCTLEVYYRHLPLFRPIDLDENK